MMPINPCCVPSKERARQFALSRHLSSERLRVFTGSVENMVRLDSGPFLMGTDSNEGFAADGEGPVRQVHVDPFFVDRTPVTNAQFEEFVRGTGYVTESERFGWSFVFQGHIPQARRAQIVEDTALGIEWWCKVPGSSWKHPEGPDSSIESKPNYPAVHVSWSDAAAFCEWAGKRLPTEAEWEYAARGGLVQKRFPWGDELTPEGEHRCNIWQGKFPDVDLGEDGYTATAPADTYAPNGYGLFTITGNAWEWCQDWFDPAWHITASRENPIGPLGGTQKVMKGGSYLCHYSYCNRYRPAARTKNTPDSATTNISFRCVRDI